MELFKTEKLFLCYSCHKALDINLNQKILRSEECPSCNSNIHSCMMCNFYCKKSYNECREPSAERITDKEKANFCDFYTFKGADTASNKDDMINVANGLFKD